MAAGRARRESAPAAPGAPGAAAAWHRAVLVAEVERARSLAGGGDLNAAMAAVAKVRADAAEALTAPPAIDTLVGAFGLSDFERDVLLLAAAAALDSRLRPPTFALVLDALPGGQWSALAPEAPLRHAGLLRLGEGPVIGAPLDVDERILHHLHGVNSLDERLHPYATALPAPPAFLPASRHDAASVLAALWRERRGREQPCAVLLHGPDARDRRDVAALAAASVSGVAWLVDAGDLPKAPAERDAFVRLWGREAALAGAIAVIEVAAHPAPDVVATTDAVLRRMAGAAIVSANDRLPTDAVAATMALRRPSRAEQAALWRRHLRGRGARVQAEALAAGFDLGHADILGAAPDLLVPAGDPLAAARARSTGRTRLLLQGLAERIEPTATWSDLVLPPESLAAVRRLAAAAAGRAGLEADGFGATTSRGLGVTALFTGPSGTGKTMAAEVVAADLGLDLHRIDLSGVVSKWIGETEKHLKRVFDAAEQGGTVLLFDEADALFGRRSEVRDSHDRYANLEVAYLLARMESYRGVAILTTNARAALDPAFLRRIRVLVAFPHPDRAQRQALWARAFPPGVAEGLDLARLAEVDLTGGDIRSAALQAALVARGEGVAVGMAQVREAIAAELAKHERSTAGLAEW